MNIKDEVNRLKSDLLSNAMRLTEKDRVTIEQYCNEYDLYLNSLEGSEQFHNQHGQVSPAVTVRNNCIKNMIALEKILPPLKMDSRMNSFRPKDF
jgi:phage terminase small subunit